MADLGNRANVMGPQPIMPVQEKPPEMLATAERVLDLLVEGNQSALEALAADDTRAQVASIAQAACGRKYSRSEITGIARTAAHYWIKGRLTGANVEPFTVQFRLGEGNGRWTIRYAANLTGKRSGWTK